MTRFYDEAIAASGLSIGQFSLLRALSRNGPTPLSQFAEQMVMERTSLYRMLAPLEARGLIAVTAGAGRARIAALTEQGRAVMEETRAAWEATQARFVQTLGEEKWRTLHALLAEATHVAEEIAA
ncbi:MarR family transcriptional regulator [Sphingomonas sp. AP4-R1]|uniref:MarR family winged helix-turn-helix transcriptional regulator n=1 Tax=Sphingomonas sp. AP4-R1 TaxID=2735134 RepID=UPI0014932BAB|nr:MarR family transcriptional regulator [Sphingomonas sp. AP4-R1]QJU56591.1 MarR family transcriptional regulator [Sphingomonas sp. AP4-R1]